MAEVYLYKILESIKGTEAERVIRQRALETAEKVVDEAVIKMQRDFENHPITREIDNGVASPNISRTLKGGDSPENLYSFIGFDEGDNPTQPIREMLDQPKTMGIKPKLAEQPYFWKNSARISYQYSVDYPRIPRKVISETKIPWLNNASWVTQIEDYIPGFRKFLSGFSFKTSRSGGGIQVKSDVTRAEFKAPKNGYLSGIFDKFMDNIRNKKFRN